MWIEYLSKKLKNQSVLFVFSDSAGAKALLSIKVQLHDIFKKVLFISNRHYDFYNEFDVQIQILKKNPINILDTFNPDFIITGTSLPVGIEMDFINDSSENKNIRTISFIDHWSNISKRFLNGEKFTYPDLIWVIDDNAKKIAISEGISEEKIMVYENPYYNFLRNFQPKISKRKFFDKLNFENTKFILYAPESISSFKSLKDKYQLDECEGLLFILDSLRSYMLEDNTKVIFKTHPNQDKEYLKSFIDRIETKDKTLVQIEESKSINDLIFYSEMVIGFSSNALIESKIMKKRVGRLLFDKNITDPISHLNLGEIITNKKELIDFYLSK